MADDVPATPDELVELLVLARLLIIELEKNRDLLKEKISGLEAQQGRLENANTELATVNANLASEVQMLRDAHHDD